MAICNAINGYTIDCDKASGGIKRILIAEHAAVETVTQDADRQVTAITMVTGEQFYEYKLQREDSDFTDVYSGVYENRTISFTPTVRFKMWKNTQLNLNEFLALAKNTSMIIAEDNNGTFFLLGLENGMDITTTAQSASGILLEDMSGIMFEFSGKEPETVCTIDPSIIDALLVA